MWWFTQSLSQHICQNYPRRIQCGLLLSTQWFSFAARFGRLWRMAQLDRCCLALEENFEKYQLGDLPRVTIGMTCIISKASVEHRRYTKKSQPMEYQMRSAEVGMVLTTAHAVTSADGETSNLSARTCIPDEIRFVFEGLWQNATSVLAWQVSSWTGHFPHILHTSANSYHKYIYIYSLYSYVYI